MTALLEARNVTQIFGEGLLTKSRTVALENFSLAIEESPPSFTAVVGESGSGKTTLAPMLLGLTTPTSGEVRYKGKDVRRMSHTDHQVRPRPFAPGAACVDRGGAPGRGSASGGDVRPIPPPTERGAAPAGHGRAGAAAPAAHHHRG